MRRSTLNSSFLLLWPSLLVAQAPTVPDFANQGPSGLASVLLDEPGDGNVWALTPTAKLRLGRDAVEFVPYFGARAPQNHPLRLRLQGAARGSEALPIDPDAVPVRKGDRVSFARGGLTERWDLDLQAAEQSFVLDRAPGSGDLVLTIALATDMTVATDAQGIVFTAPGLGKVRYGELTARDATAASIGFDGQRFTYAYEEQVGTTQQTFAATRNLDLSSVESHVAIGTATTREIEARITSRAESGGNPGRHFICWSRQSAGNSHVQGALWNGIAPGSTVSRVATGCGGLFEPDITLSDIPTLGADLTVATTPILPASQFVLVGFPRSSPLALCGNTCRQGVDPIVTAVFGTSWHVAIPANQSLVGTTIAAQGLLLGVGGGCPATLFGVPFLVSDTLRITVR